MKNVPSPDDFESALRRDAARMRARAVPSDDLAARIVRDVHRSRVPAAEEPARFSWRWPVISLAGLAACTALAFMMLSPAKEPGDHPRVVVEPPALAPSETAPAPAELWAAIKPEAEALLAQDPLQSEVDAVVSDARSAIRFLALNFLPSATVDDSQPRSG